MTEYYEDDLISDEREFSDDMNIWRNDQSAFGEIGYEDTPVMSNAHSRRSRLMEYEKTHGWDDNYVPHRDLV